MIINFIIIKFKNVIMNMNMNMNVYLQIQIQITEYEKIEDFFEKVQFVEHHVTQYANKKDSPGYVYWSSVLENLYYLGFNYY